MARQSNIKYRYGRCLNDNYNDTKQKCPMCESREVQQIQANRDFVCKTCGKKLSECAPPAPKTNPVKKYGVIAAIVLVVALGVWLALSWGAHDDIEVPPTAVAADTVFLGTDTVTIEKNIFAINKYQTGETYKNDTIKIGEVPEVPEEPVVEEAKDQDTPKEPVKVTTPPQTGIKVPFGVYTGPSNGLDGEIKVTKHYSLDLRNAAHETIELQPGDVITRTKFKNGELVSGYWSRGTERRAFHR